MDFAKGRFSYNYNRGRLQSESSLLLLSHWIDFNFCGIFCKMESSTSWKCILFMNPFISLGKMTKISKIGWDHERLDKSSDDFPDFRNFGHFSQTNEWIHKKYTFSESQRLHLSKNTTKIKIHSVAQKQQRRFRL